jgi:hypothetical protein
VKGVEPSSIAWEAIVLPLYYTRIIFNFILTIKKNFSISATLNPLLPAIAPNLGGIFKPLKTILKKPYFQANSF